MNYEEFEKIFDSEDTDWTGDNALQGLLIISKYINHKDNDLIVAAEHDIIYSVSIEDIIEAGITEEDVKQLRKLNWMIEQES